jgi:hypothetical protein
VTNDVRIDFTPIIYIMYWLDIVFVSLLPCPQASQKENAQKGGGMTTLIQEGTQLFLGETAGKVVGSGLAVVNVGSKSNANRDVDFDEVDEAEDQVENPAAVQVDHL